MCLQPHRGYPLPPLTNAIADRSLVLVDTGAEEEIATIVLAAPPGSSPVKTRRGVKPVLTLTGEQLDGESEGGTIRDRELVFRVEEAEFQLTGCMAGHGNGCGKGKSWVKFFQASPVRIERIQSVDEELA